MHVRLGQPVHEVAQVAVGEHRVLGAPEQQGGNLEGADALGDCIERAAAGVVFGEGDVGNEVCHSRTPGRVEVRGHEGLADGGLQGRLRQGVGGAQERVGGLGAPAVDGGV
ncbi:hypothetical protein D9M71_830070 [compost metagenome]